MYVTNLCPFHRREVEKVSKFFYYIIIFTSYFIKLARLIGLNMPQIVSF